MEAEVKIRIDKWLWAARFFKTRSLATQACDQGRIMVDGQIVKPSRMVRAGDRIEVKRTGITLMVRILQPIEKRVGAKLIPEVYTDLTPPEVIEAYRLRALRASGFRDPGAGRPTKNERRALDDFFEVDDFE
ncbi:MAG: RNA-binding S4 domain-containing protein [Bacteroidota bacterium]